MAVNPQVLDFLYEITKDTPQGQLEAARALDTKLVQVFGPASVVMGLTQLLGATGGAIGTGLLIAALVLYLAVVVTCMAGLWARDFRVSWHADALWRRYWQ